MALTTGIEHAALVTKDLDAFIGFYTEVFDGEVLFDLREGGMRHAGVAVGNGSYLHPFQHPGNTHAEGLPTAFDRGHLDHLALSAPDQETFEELRRRLVARGASDGTVTDWGICREVNFVDPDGHHGEISLWVGKAPRTWDERGVEPLSLNFAR